MIQQTGLGHETISKAVCANYLETEYSFWQGNSGFTPINHPLNGRLSILLPVLGTLRKVRNRNKIRNMRDNDILLQSIFSSIVSVYCASSRCAINWAAEQQASLLKTAIELFMSSWQHSYSARIC